VNRDPQNGDPFARANRDPDLGPERLDKGKTGKGRLY
jgi:hypothetical protein